MYEGGGVLYKSCHMYMYIAEKEGGVQSRNYRFNTALYNYVSHQPSITDAFNETKDKVKYLESLRKYFDQLNVGGSLVNICSNTLPGLMASVRQMDAISRYYARNGYLGLLFSKVITTRITKPGFLVWQKYFIINLSVCSVHRTDHFLSYLVPLFQNRAL